MLASYDASIKILASMELRIPLMILFKFYLPRYVSTSQYHVEVQRH